MNMGTASLTREQLNEAISEFADKIWEALGADVTDEETTNEAELTGTHFKAVNLKGNVVKLDAEGISVGTLVADGAFEYFRCVSGGETGPWVRYSGRSYSHEQFAAEMRNTYAPPRIVHEG